MLGKIPDPAEVATGGALQKSCSEKSRNIHKKTPVLEL